MIYNDIIAQGHPGAFHLLPLGQRVLDKLIKVIDEELDSIGAQKMSMPTLAKAELWKKTSKFSFYSKRHTTTLAKAFLHLAKAEDFLCTIHSNIHS